jgi:4-amino-4-deoxy-L-arabinose transferase-like glycosyltransferase
MMLATGHVAVLTAILPSRSAARMRWLACALAVAAGCLLFVPWAWIHPLGVCDEARLAVNAIEMSQSGLSFVTTYEFQPDLWNTKPPLMIWLMVVSLKLFGPAEWALRLPALLASTGTLAVVALFTYRITRSAVAGAFACVLLAASSSFFGRHAAVTADYDALLCLFTTAYAYVFFQELHRARPRPSRVLAGAALVTAAVLTKGIAGLMPVAGIAVYLVASRRWNRLYQRPIYVVAAICVLAAACAFYAWREHLAPGYLAAVSHNEWGGRYVTTLEGHVGPPSYYLTILTAGGFSLGVIGLLSPLGLAVARGRVRIGLAFSSCLAYGLLAVISLGATKLAWYVAPALPFFSISTAIAGAAIARALTIWIPRYTDIWRQGSVVACAIISANILTQAVIVQYSDIDPDWDYDAHYGKILAELRHRGIRDVLILNTGVYNGEGRKNYAPQLRYYSHMASPDSLRVQIAASRDQTLPPSGAVASCDPTFILGVTKIAGKRIDVDPRCAVVLVGQDGAVSSGIAGGDS